jgi:hypothetical protein
MDQHGIHMVILKLRDRRYAPGALPAGQEKKFGWLRKLWKYAADKEGTQDIFSKRECSLRRVGDWLPVNSGQ